MVAVKEKNGSWVWNRLNQKWYSDEAQRILKQEESLGMLVVLSHPNFAASRLNKALANAAKNAGAEVRHLEGLYGTDALKIDVAAEQEAFLRADRIVFLFPMMGFGVPSMENKGKYYITTPICYPSSNYFSAAAASGAYQLRLYYLCYKSR